MKTFKEFITEAQRLRVLRTAHYTTPEAKEKIMSQGFGPSRSGVYRPRGSENTVYTTPSSRIGKDYGISRVNLTIVNPKVNRTASKGKYFDTYQQASEKQRAKMKQPEVHSKELISGGSKVVSVPDAHTDSDKKPGSYIMVDKDLANKSISKNPQPTIRVTGKARRACRA